MIETFKPNRVNYLKSRKMPYQKYLAAKLPSFGGPPGAGKTTLIAYLIYEFIEREKRVLLVSNTNVAVDNALEKLAMILQKKSNPAFFAGRILRFGVPSSTELFNKFKELDLNYWVEEKTKEINKQLEILRSELTQLDII